MYLLCTPEKLERKPELTSPGTLYFFITIPVSQSITQRESPPLVATSRLPPAVKGRGCLSVSSVVSTEPDWSSHVKLNILVTGSYRPSRTAAGTRRPTAGWRSPQSCPGCCDTEGHAAASGELAKRGGNVPCLMISARVMDKHSLLAPTANISLFAS